MGKEIVGYWWEVEEQFTYAADASVPYLRLVPAYPNHHRLKEGDRSGREALVADGSPQALETLEWIHRVSS